MDFPKPTKTSQASPEAAEKKSVIRDVYGGQPSNER
jgi:hypothetical protein